jgi:hypothetical protein
MLKKIFLKYIKGLSRFVISKKKLNFKMYDLKT